MDKLSQAINIFDFDGTLTTETWPKFWVWVKKFGYQGHERNEELEQALDSYRRKNPGSYMETFFTFFSDLLMTNQTAISYDELMEGEKYIVYNLGVIDYLKESQENNYIVSGGLKEFLEHLMIASYFDGVYGTPVIHDTLGNICRIGQVMSDDGKVEAIREILKKNNRQENDCRNVLFIGDGYSDAASMRFIHENGGKAVFVYPVDKDDYYYEHNKSIYNKLMEENIVDYCVAADYRKGKDLRKILNREE